MGWAGSGMESRWGEQRVGWIEGGMVDRQWVGRIVGWTESGVG